jgi:hypothetical protein
VRPVGAREAAGVPGGKEGVEGVGTAGEAVDGGHASILDRKNFVVNTIDYTVMYE